MGNLIGENLVAVIPLGSLSADKSLPAFLCSGPVVLKNVTLLNGAAIAASDTDFVQLSLQAGDEVLAELDSRAAHENGIAELAAEPLNLVEGKEKVAGGTVLKAVYNETDSGTAVALTDAVLIVEYLPL